MSQWNEAMQKALSDFVKSKDMILGICYAEPLTDIKPLLLKQPTPFVNQDIEKRITAQTFLPGAMSIIVTGLGYGKTALPAVGSVGILSQMAAGPDYHFILKNILEEAVVLLKKYKDFKYRISVDDGPLVERSLAVHAGLGFYGKNHMVISRHMGSFFNIGCIVTDLGLLDDYKIVSEKSMCGNCRACVDACPGGALGKDGEFFDYKLCVSYLTQKKGDLAPREREIIGNHIYGCDICQSVCPYNKDILREKVPSEILYPSLESLLALTEGDFQKIYGRTAAGWRGLSVIQRNAGIAAENQIRGLT